MNLLQKFEHKTLTEVVSKRKAIEQNPVKGKEKDSGKFDFFNVGDTIDVGVKIADISGSRVQHYEGICIARTNKALRSSFTVRRIGADTEGIEQIFMYYLSNIDSIRLVKSGHVRRAKLYYLQTLTGKAGKIKEARNISSEDKKPVRDIKRTAKKTISTTAK